MRITPVPASDVGVASLSVARIGNCYACHVLNKIHGSLDLVSYPDPPSVEEKGLVTFEQILSCADSAVLVVVILAKHIYIPYQLH